MAFHHEVEEPEFLGLLGRHEAVALHRLLHHRHRLAGVPGVDLVQTAARCENLSGVDLRSAKLRRTKLRKANLAGVRFIGADLYEADFEGSILTSADFSGANPATALTLTEGQLAMAAPIRERRGFLARLGIG